ncbi:MAG: tetratricopeptide repeat protein [Candidatus Methanomethylophilaceae archaeon]|jgi:TPR repeat protein
MNTAHDISALLYKANNGDPHAQTDLGLAYMNGDGIPRDISRAVRWLSEAAENSNYTEAKEKLGEAYEILRKYDLAEKWYTEAADERNAEAMYRLGLLIYRGTLGFRPGKEGIDLLERAAKKGHKGAREYLDTYVNDPKSKRFSKVAEYKARAELGDVGAQFFLGNSYENGLDVPKDNMNATVWYRMAAEQGHSRAQYRLGMMYWEGRGVPQDRDEAKVFFKLAAEQGNTEAKKMLEKE